jgi:hypothetical protein
MLTKSENTNNLTALKIIHQKSYLLEVKLEAMNDFITVIKKGEYRSNHLLLLLTNKRQNLKSTLLEVRISNLDQAKRSFLQFLTLKDLKERHI